MKSCKLDSCINKTYFVTTYENFMEDLQKNHRDYSEKDWESKDLKMKEFVDNCYETHVEKLTAAEKINFWTKYVKYMILRHGPKAITEIEIEDKDSSVEIYNEILTTLKDGSFEEMLKEIYGKDIEKNIDEVLKEINKWGDQLKDWLQNRSN